LVVVVAWARKIANAYYIHPLLFTFLKVARSIQDNMNKIAEDILYNLDSFSIIFFFFFETSLCVAAVVSKYRTIVQYYR
ncbi:hypothetical protein ACJX0J_032179, partial [Zea mays]